MNKQDKSYTQHHSDEIADIFRNEPCCLGVDEAGRGPVLGNVRPYDMPNSKAQWFMESHIVHWNGTRNSEPAAWTLTAEKRDELLGVITAADWIGWSIHVLSPADISSSMLRRSKYNLNALAHDATILLIKSAIDQGVNVKQVFVDTVGPPEKYQQMLSQIFPSLKITVAKKADSIYPVVGTASICAKVYRDNILDNWEFSEKQEFSKGLGSGYPGDPLTKEWLRNNMNKVFGFPSLIRFSWSTVTTLLESNGVPVRWAHEDDDEESDEPPAKKQKQAKLDVYLNKGYQNRGKMFQRMQLGLVTEDL